MGEREEKLEIGEKTTRRPEGLAKRKRTTYSSTVMPKYFFLMRSNTCGA